MFLRAFALLQLGLFLASNTAPAQHLIGGGIFNGSFESGIDPGVSINLGSPDSTTIQGWTISSGSIDYIGSRWVAGDGNRCLDLSGLGPGTILQTVPGFIAGQQYELSFLMAGNPEGGPTIKTLRASVGATSQNFAFDITGATPTHLGWTTRALDFTATGSSMDVTFASLNAEPFGPALDNVRIVPVPEPSVWALTGSLLFVLCLLGRKQKNVLRLAP